MYFYLVSPHLHSNIIRLRPIKYENPLTKRFFVNVYKKPSAIQVVRVSLELCKVLSLL